MTDALITELQKISALRVISRTSVMQYKKEPKPLSQIAKELNVDAVIEGSLQGDQDTIHLTTRLIQTVPEKLLWMGEDERHRGEILTLQKNIARAIANELDINLTPEEAANLTRTKTVNPEAYELYLKGNYYVLDHPTIQASQIGIEYYLKALEIDSSFAQVYAALADAYMSLGNMGIAAPNEVLPIAKKYAQKAFELDESLAEVHAALGYIKMHEWDWQGAEESMERAIKLNPGWSFGYANHSWIMAVLGRFDKSIASAVKVQDLNPLSPGTMIGERLYEAGRYDEAIKQLKKTLDSDPLSAYAHWFLGFTYEQKQMYDEAIHHHKKAVDYSGGMASNMASLGHAYAMSGKKDEAYNTLDELMELSKEQYISSYDIAVVYAGLGEIDEAMRWLEKAVEKRDGYLGGFINVDRRWDFLRSDDRFVKVLRTIGF
jgi:tetratricopeptide (TPR) repeat protein